MSDRVSTTEAREEGFYWIILGQNPPEIAYWERGEWCWPVTLSRGRGSQ